MPNSTEKILQELEQERIRRENLTKKDLQKAYLNLEKENFPDDKTIAFTANLGACKEIAYHYELICKDWEKDRQLHFESSFDRHGSAGIEFLFEHLNKINDEKLKIFTVYLIAEILSQSEHRDFYTSFCNRLISVIVSLIGTNNIFRHKLIIALGWIGTSKEIDLLIRQMLDDEDSLCRAWSAASLMQMSFHRVKQETLRKKAKPAFARVIAEEKDPYTCGIMIEAAQTLFNKKWISSSAVENSDAEKIEKARKSAVRFLTKN